MGNSNSDGVVLLKPGGGQAEDEFFFTPAERVLLDEVFGGGLAPDGV